MHSETWQTVQHLLIWRLGNEAIDALEPALCALRQNLPTVQMTLLTVISQSACSSLDKLYQLQFTSLNPSTDKVIHAQTFLSLQDIIETLRLSFFDAAIIFTASFQSPYAAGYLCYLAGIPIRIGQSREFGGGVLSYGVTPPLDLVSEANYHLHLLEAIGFSNDQKAVSTQH